VTELKLVRGFFDEKPKVSTRAFWFFASIITLLNIIEMIIHLFDKHQMVISSKITENKGTLK
jgi:hypothetical protein